MFRLIIYGLFFLAGVYVGSNYLGQQDLPAVSLDLFSGQNEVVSQPAVQEGVVEVAPLDRTYRAVSSVPHQQEETLQKVDQPVLQETVRLYAVQVASLKDLGRAEKLVSQLQAEELNAYISPSDLRSKSQYYRIFVGEYVSKEDARAKLSSLQERFSGAFVKTF